MARRDARVLSDRAPLHPTVTLAAAVDSTVDLADGRRVVMPGRDSKGAEPHRFSRFLHENGLLLTCLALFSVFFLGMIVSGAATYNQEQLAHGSTEQISVLEISHHRRLCGGHLRELGVGIPADGHVCGVDGTAVPEGFVGVEAARKRAPQDADPRDVTPSPDTPWPVKKGGWVLSVYEHSLSIAFFALVLCVRRPPCPWGRQGVQRGADPARRGGGLDVALCDHLAVLVRIDAELAERVRRRRRHRRLVDLPSATWLARIETRCRSTLRDQRLTTAPGFARTVGSVTTQAVAQASGTFTLGGDLTVNRLGYGAMRITGKGVWGPPADRDEARPRAAPRRRARRRLHRHRRLATAPTSPRSSSARRCTRTPTASSIATKAGLTAHRARTSGRRSAARSTCARRREMSLRRLGVERIDLCQLHRIDSKFPADDQFGELIALQQEGKIRHIGLSEVSVDEIEAAQKVADDRVGAEPLQPRRPRRRGVLDYCEPHRASASSRGSRSPPASWRRPAARCSASPTTHHATPAQLALAWLLQRSPVMLPIPGTSRVAHLEENVAAAEIRLSDDEFDTLSNAGSAG